MAKFVTHIVNTKHSLKGPAIHGTTCGPLCNRRRQIFSLWDFIRPIHRPYTELLRIFGNDGAARTTRVSRVLPTRAKLCAFQREVGNTDGIRVKQVVSTFQKILRGWQLAWYIYCECMSCIHGAVLCTVLT